MKRYRDIKSTPEVRTGRKTGSMSEPSQQTQPIDIEQGISDIISLIEQEREREIITRRFGLYDRRETLEQIGELLGITRERVRQLEKSILVRLRTAAEEGKTDAISQLEKLCIRELSEFGRIARIQDLADKLYGKPTDAKQRAHIGFIAALAPNLTVVDENDHYFHAAGIAQYGDSAAFRAQIDKVVKTIKEHGEPLTLDELFDKIGGEHPSHVQALASVSKHLAFLNGYWGLVKWPTVNPKNIRDKIYVVLSDRKKPMHFSDIAKAIKNSDFKRKDVTTQAIHNELIKDSRFVLIGRGIYALDNWGYSKGTVSDIIAKVLKNAKEPLHRDEIVRRVLKSRQVKETTILLNLQSKPQFKRVAKATYTLAE